ncbi:SusC/RagA family TonB-linked outer membrane protein [Pedobacter puniceum]|uniref:SusC/RagA family TonB-linked outer membrane protein n=1 Tax=Pedobacter puniceum TaxID=2666136 RepID=A0A7K0FMN7_9SPHI|nr:TonB-dependent receptor [Pedobacter puniceum]MRX46931.1 SusC/RagA family TonB-linked outer membrane protein [Pedobacter puniceum]
MKKKQLVATIRLVKLISFIPIATTVLSSNTLYANATSKESNFYKTKIQNSKKSSYLLNSNKVQFTVTGTVTDSDGLPLAGAAVSIKKGNLTTLTDINGKFTIKAQPDDVLVVSYLGSITQEVPINKRTNINIIMANSEKSLDEVVVVGYGTQRKRDVTGAISSISEDKIKAFPVISADQALQGRAAGVQVVQTSGAPGGAVQVRIRGTNSTAGGGANQPLYVVDGVPLFYDERQNALNFGNEGSTGGPASNAASPLTTISPNDIESIEVLKDASATAIYGSRAANGVVLITTKMGKSGKSVVTFNANYGVQSLREKIPMLNAQERIAFAQEHRRNAGTRGNEVIDVFTVNPYTFGRGTDWQDEVFRSAQMSNYNLGFSGGKDNLTYSISGDYFNQEGIILNTFSKRAGTRVNLDFKVNEKLKFGTRSTLNYQWENVARTDEYFQGIVMNLLGTSPVTPVFDANGNYAGRPNTLINFNFYNSGNNNTVANLMESTRRVDRYRALSNVFGEYDITSKLKFKSSFGIDYLFTNLRTVDPVFFRGVDTNTPMNVFQASPKTFNWITEQTLSFTEKIKKHSFNVLAGFSAQNISRQTFSANATGSINNALDQLGNQTSSGTISGGANEQGLVSQFLRLNYDFGGKYLLTATARRDGSSRFGEKNKYGLFPSASVGWRISEENFLKDIQQISDLKLRASYGSVGSQEIGNFLFAALASPTQAVFGNAYRPGVAPNRFQNEDIRWEVTNTLDLGLDLGLFNGRLNFTVDYYSKLTKGLLGLAPLSVISGVGNGYTSNIGSISNKGIEFAANVQVINNKNFKWNVDFNISTNVNEVKSLGDQPFINGAPTSRTPFINRTQPGQPIGAFYVLRNNGMYTTWAEASAALPYTITAQPYFTPGDYRIVDTNGDNRITDDDRQFVGSPFPDYFGGFNTSLSYKNWTFSVFAPFQVGNLIWNQPFLHNSTFEVNATRFIYNNRYIPSNPTQQTLIPVPRANNPLTPSELYLQDGSFLRIRSLTLAYDFSSKELSFLPKQSRLRVFAQGNNLFVFHNYKGWDPEVSSFGSNVITNGIDAGAYPQAKSFNFGLNVSF